MYLRHWLGRVPPEFSYYKNMLNKIKEKHYSCVTILYCNYYNLITSIYYIYIYIFILIKKLNVC